jgi:hypothetical protein
MNARGIIWVERLLLAHFASVALTSVFCSR